MAWDLFIGNIHHNEELLRNHINMSLTLLRVFLSQEDESYAYNMDYGEFESDTETPRTENKG